MGYCLVADHDLGDAARVAEVDEGDTTVVASSRDPAGERDDLVDVVEPESAGVVGADHARWSFLIRRGRRSSRGGAQLAPSATTCSPLRMSLTSSGLPS